jgi:hypothetical protein
MRQLHQWLLAPEIVLIKKVKIHVMNWSKMDDKRALCTQLCQ